jgi:hypothetical protein
MRRRAPRAPRRRRANATMSSGDTQPVQPVSIFAWTAASGRRPARARRGADHVDLQGPPAPAATTHLGIAGSTPKKATGVLGLRPWHDAPDHRRDLLRLVRGRHAEHATAGHGQGLRTVGGPVPVGVGLHHRRRRTVPQATDLRGLCASATVDPCHRSAGKRGFGGSGRAATAATGGIPRRPRL